MSIFMKSKKRVSSRQQIAIEGVQAEILLLPNHEYRAVLDVSAVNFELKSEAEQDALIATYQSFLNSLPTNLQILVRVRELDMDKYLSDFEERSSSEHNEIYRNQANQYVKFVSKLVTTNKILTRHFYVVVPQSRESDFSVAKAQLSLNVDIVAKGLQRMGMHSKRLNNLELLELFYSFYNPIDAKRQPITDQTLTMLEEAYV